MAWLIQSCNEGADIYRVSCFIDDNAALHGTELNGIPIMGLELARERFPSASVVGAVGNPQTRERMMAKAAAAGFGFETIIHPRTNALSGSQSALEQ